MPSATMDVINQDPKKAALTYQRHDCQRCHIGVRGREKRGDYRGMGCSACHVLYSNDGFYENNDKTIPKDKPGHMLKHEIVATRKTGGIPVESCNSCHANLKTAGLGLGGGTFGTMQYTDIIEDLINAKTGEIIPQKYSVQIPGIPKLKFDWSKIVERDGTQVATVGTHWPMSRAFNKEELDVES
jgi:hypothetical protein